MARDRLLPWVMMMMTMMTMTMTMVMTKNDKHCNERCPLVVFVTFAGRNNVYRYIRPAKDHSLGGGGLVFRGVKLT